METNEMTLAEKMKVSANLGEVVETTVLDFSLQGNHPHLNIPLSHLKYHSGDRVRVIIMKEQ